MFTVGDIGAIPVLSALAQAELERLARTSADIRLSPGEFAERALFAVLSGKIKVINTYDRCTCPPMTKADKLDRWSNSNAGLLAASLRASPTTITKALLCNLFNGRL